MNTQHGKHNDDWHSPPEGYLASIGSQVDASRRWQSLRRHGLGLAIVLFTAGVGIWGIGRVVQTDDDAMPSIPCSVVKENLMAFVDGTLDADLTEQVEAHLANCVRCRAMLATMRSSEAGRIPDQNAMASMWYEPPRFSNLLLARK